MQQGAIRVNRAEVRLTFRRERFDILDVLSNGLTFVFSVVAFGSVLLELGYWQT